MDRNELLRLLARAFEARRYLLKISDVLGHSVGFRERGGMRTDEPVLVVYVKKGRKRKDHRKLPRHQRIPSRIRLTVRDKPVWLGVDIVECEEGKLGAAAAPPGDVIGAKRLDAGASVANRLSGEHTGTIGWIARRSAGNKVVVCGNYHVFLRGDHYGGKDPKKRFLPDRNAPEELISPSKEDGGDLNTDRIGIVIRGERSFLVDVAIAIPERGAYVATPPQMIGVGAVGPARNYQATDLDPDNPTPVILSGRSSKDKRGVILEYPASFEFGYPDKIVRLYDLIVTDIATLPGDSGSLLVDEQLRPLGMLIGRGGARSFFMHISNIRSAMRIKDC